MSEYDKLVEAYESLSDNYKKLESENADLKQAWDKTNKENIEMFREIENLKKQLLELQSNPPKVVGASKVFSTMLPKRPERL